MRQLFISFLLLVLAQTGFSQARIIMKIDNITAPNGDTLTAFESNFAVTSSIGGGSGGAGGTAQTVFDDIKITKPVSLSTQLVKNALKGSSLPKAEFDFLDNNNNVQYKIILTGVVVTKFSFLSPECPTCQKLSNEIWLNSQTIQYTDVVHNITVTYNKTTNTVN